MRLKLSTSSFITLFFTSILFANTNEYLIKFKNTNSLITTEFSNNHGGKLELVSTAGQLYKWVGDASLNQLKDPDVEYIERNHRIHLFINPSIAAHRMALINALDADWISANRGPAFPDNPDIEKPTVQSIGTDPLLSQAWGMFTIGAVKAWEKTSQGKDIIVAITDTGVDYNHPDLINNMWRDDQGNVGRDFVSNDDKPYDLSMSLTDIIFKNANPGHGTHCAGVVGARLNNAQGTAGVAPRAKIMAVRFINESGEGDTAGAVRAVDYAVEHGARIISASWGNEGEEQGDQALREAILRAKDKGVLFVAAAGNGRLNPQTMQAAGYDNDTDAKPIYPASYDYDNVIAVAAVDNQDKLAAFSNWGRKSVKLGAPGVKILSTVPGNRYQDTIIDLGQIKATWDGTSMATPFVAGSLAVIWAQNPNQNWEAVKEILLSHTVISDHLKGKVATDGRVDLHGIRRHHH